MKRKTRSANVEEHPKGSGVYRVRARIRGKLVTVASGLPEKRAVAVANQYGQMREESDLREGITLSQYGVDWLDRRERLGMRAIREDRNRWRKYIDEEPLGGIPLAALRRSDVVEWRDTLINRGLAEQTIKNALNLVRVAVDDALDRELCNENVARTVKVPRHVGKRKSKDDLDGILIPTEQQALLDQVPAEHQPLVVAALVTGVRWSELSWLRREDIQGEILVIQRSRGGGPPKNGKTRRVPLLPPARAALVVQLTKIPKRCPWVFPGAHGKPRKQSPKKFGEWVLNAGIKRRVVWHDLRHTCATSLLGGWWSQQRWTLDEVCQMLGHESIKTTERYARKLDETLQEAARRTKFPHGNGSGGGSGNHSGANAFLNRWSHVRVVPGAPNDSGKLTDPDALALGTSGELPADRICRRLDAGSEYDGAAKEALLEGIEAAFAGDADGVEAALRKAGDALGWLCADGTRADGGGS